MKNGPKEYYPSKMIPAFWMVFSTILTISWSIPFLLVPLVGFRFYVLSENKVMKLIKRLPKYSSITYNDDPEGWIVGWPFIGYIDHSRGSHGEESRRLYLFTTTTYYHNKIKEIDAMDSSSTTESTQVKEKPQWIDLYEREGCYAYIYYTKRTFDVQPFQSRPNQKAIIEEILTAYESHRHLVIVLHGEKGVGKSMIPLLLAKELTLRHPREENLVRFCDTHKPTDPGDHFNNLYQRADPTRDSPLIVVFEEFDGMIHAIHHQTITKHDAITTAIIDKASWNQFFDRMDRGYYPWTLLFLTTNHSPDTIHRMDPSYLRKGRVDLVFEVLDAPPE